MSTNIKELLMELTSLSAPSGFEQPLVEYIEAKLVDKVDALEIDSMGNIYAKKKGEKPGPVVMMMAHTDEVGFIVRSIEESGYIRIQQLGGIKFNITPGHKVIIKEEYLGVIGTRPAHLYNIKESSNESWSEIYVDVGLSSKEEVKKLGINIGDPVTFKEDLETFSMSNRICGKSIDNRAGVAALINLFYEIDNNFSGEIVGVFSVQEEIGCRGAKVAAYKINPDFAIVVDTVPAGDTPDVQTIKELPVYLGKGLVFTLAIGDKHRGNIMHPYLKSKFIELAEELTIPYQLVTRIGPTANDASSIHLAKDGVPTASVTIPRRYSHSPVEVMDLRDLKSVSNFLSAVIYRADKFKKITFLDK